jgi:hypothetical protein
MTLPPCDSSKFGLKFEFFLVNERKIFRSSKTKLSFLGAVLSNHSNKYNGIETAIFDQSETKILGDQKTTLDDDDNNNSENDLRDDVGKRSVGHWLYFERVGSVWFE